MTAMIKTMMMMIMMGIQRLTTDDGVLISVVTAVIHAITERVDKHTDVCIWTDHHVVDTAEWSCTQNTLNNAIYVVQSTSMSYTLLNKSSQSESVCIV